MDRRPGYLTAIFWDVQHGHATYVQTPGGKDIVVDLGIGQLSGSDRNFSPLLHLKRTRPGLTLDGAIITHPHRDHIDDIFNFARLAPRTLIRPKHLTEADVRRNVQPGDVAVIDKYLEICRSYASSVTQGDNPFKAEDNGGAKFRVFMPERCGRSNLNNHSVVTVVSYAGTKLLIPGDNEPPSWNELLERQEFRDAIRDTDIFLAPHHGRASACSDALFAHISPRLTIISDGPEGETSATGWYTSRSRGMIAHKRGGGSETRYCVTTRKDGVIRVLCWTGADGRNCVNVTID